MMKMIYYFIFTCLLFVFWFLLSGYTTTLLLSLGLASVVLVIWLINRMDKVDKAPVRMLFNLEFVFYLGWLIKEVIVTNIDVAYRIWHTSLPINPATRKIKVKIKDPLLKTIYANSITLTPGTVTTEVGDDYFIVHALNVKSIEELQKGEMEARLIRLEQSK